MRDTMKTLNQYDARLVEALRKDLGEGESEQDLLDYLERSYDGAFFELADWAIYHLEETGELDNLQNIPPHLEDYIHNGGDFDFYQYADDQAENERIYTIEFGDGKVHVFRNY